MNRNTILSVFALVMMIFVSACEPVNTAPETTISLNQTATPTPTQTTISFNYKYVVHDQLYYSYSDEVLDDNTVIYLMSADAGIDLLLPSYTVYEKWYTYFEGKAIRHNSKLAVPGDDLVPMIAEPVSLPFGGVATPMPTPTAIPEGTIVFHDRYTSDSGETVYIDGIYNHLTRSFGIGLPEEGGKFNEWYTIEDDKAVKHKGEISLQGNGYEYSEVGWSFLIK